MSTESRPFAAVAVALLALVAVGHLLRVVLGLEVVVGGYAVPMWVSVVATLVAGGLSVLLRRESSG
jgi:hypothetical protein